MIRFSKLSFFILCNSIFCLSCIVSQAVAQKGTSYILQSPDKKISVKVDIGKQIEWSVQHVKTPVLSASPISMELGDNEMLGTSPKVLSSKTTTINEVFATPVYKKQSVKNNYNQLQLNFKGAYSLEFRAFDDGVAYRFVTNKKGNIVVVNENTNFIFDKDYKTFTPYVRDLREGDKLQSSFEALYDEVTLSEIPKDTLAFLPMLVELNDGKKACLLETDLENYPGMFVRYNGQNGLQGFFAKYPSKERNGGFMYLNYMVTARENFLVKTNGTRTFPWRAIVISETDKELANNDMVQKLASPSRINDMSWIKPGKVAWDWWNDWNISHVDFVAGVNTSTYKYYIDFASRNKIEYVVMDEGWSSDTSLLLISDKIDVEEIVKYAKQKNVGIILWASWYSIQKDLISAFDKYSKMGVKGFKIDFMDRDDAKMVTSLYEIAKAAADYKLLIDYHGMYKPTGIQRTYPNIVNFEGVKGLENVKWTPNDDMPRYDVSIPFIRMISGPMDYTPGAMRNVNKSNFHPSHTNPMSQGTRCHQLAMYTIFEAPLQMMADNPTAYMKEQECTDFIAQVPTVFDETVALDGKVGEYVALARRNKNTWYIGAMTNWNGREIVLDFSFLGEGIFEIDLFKDGLNAEKEATDYKREKITISSKDKMKVKMASGGGLAAIVRKK
jgi:alpha-glucosidase